MRLKDLNVSTLGDAHRFDSMDGSDMALAGYNANTCTIGSGGIVRSILDYFHGINREIQVAPILREHICCRCEFAMRNQNSSHYLFRFVPMKYQDKDSYISGSLDSSKDELATFCTESMSQSVFPKIPDDEKKVIPLIVTPLRDCTGFMERKN